MGANYRGIVTADVLELGLSRGAIAARKLEGVKRDKEHEGLYWFGPFWFEVVLIRVSMTRELNCYAWLSMRSFLSLNRCRVAPLYREVDAQRLSESRPAYK